MKALVYRGPGIVKLEDRDKPTIEDPTDAIVKIKYTSICGSDLHIQKGHVASVQPGTTLGHEGIGTIDEVGDGVKVFKKGDKVLIACICSCSACKLCRQGLWSHCDMKDGGWVLGNTVNGCQAEYVRIPWADSSLYRVPEGIDEKKLVLISDVAPTGYEVGVLAGDVRPGKSVVIVGVGPIGLGALITAKLLSPSIIIAIDIDPARVEAAKRMGADVGIDSSKEDALKRVMELTDNKGVDVAIEAVGAKDTFDLCQDVIGFGGTIANIGVHGTATDLKLEKLWGYNIAIRTGFVNTTSTANLLRMFTAGTLKFDNMITHEFNLQTEGEQAYQTFGDAAKHEALKMIITT